MPLGVEAGSAMLKLLPQLDEMLKKTGGKLGKIVSYQGYPEAYQDLALGRIDYVVNVWLSLQTVAKEKPDDLRGRPGGFRADLHCLSAGEGQHRAADCDQRLPARRAQGRLDVRAAEEIFRDHLRENAGGGLRKRLIPPQPWAEGDYPGPGGRGGKHNRRQRAGDCDRHCRSGLAWR